MIIEKTKTGQRIAPLVALLPIATTNQIKVRGFGGRGAYTQNTREPKANKNTKRMPCT